MSRGVHTGPLELYLGGYHVDDKKIAALYDEDVLQSTLFAYLYDHPHVHF